MTLIWATTTGAISVSRTLSDVHVTMSGSVTEASAKPAYVAIVKQLKVGPAVMWWDLWDLKDYHSSVRILCTEALLEGRASITGLHHCVRASIVSMGVSVALMATGIQAMRHGTHEEFLRARDRMARAS